MDVAGKLTCEYEFDDLYQPFSWQGEGLEEKGIEKATGKVRVEVDPKYFRPTEVVSLPPLVPPLVDCLLAT